MSQDSRDRLIDHASGAMLGLAIGDALGATVEFMTPREIVAQFGVRLACELIRLSPAWRGHDVSALAEPDRT